jgi:hypothetical protein
MKNQIAENIKRRTRYRLAGIALISTLIAVATAMTGCTGKAERFILEADKAQIGAGARIEMEGKAGRIKMAAIPGWPNGIDKAVTLNPDSDLPMGQLWTVTMEPKLELVFIRSPNGWICQSCVYFHLPLAWHPVAR